MRGGVSGMLCVGMARGSLALILHAHLPYVRHPEYPQFLEEEWLFEAITETYLPLLQMLEGLVQDEVPCLLTLSLTPTLCTMLRDPLLQERYLGYLDRAIALAELEISRTSHHAEVHRLACFYRDRFRACRERFETRWGRNLVAAFAGMQERGVIEIITCAASHGFLPLMENYPEAVRAQIGVACDHYRDCFGCDPQGIWLPECGYVPGLEAVLSQENLRWFVIDSHGLMFANPRPRHAIYAPCYTPAGPAVFARDRESSRQVWSAEEGYPGDPAYRDFYRDIGFDLAEHQLEGFLAPGAPRRFSGIKYHRITGRNVPHKELYRRDWALSAVEAHAAHFLESRIRQIDDLTRQPPSSSSRTGEGERNGFAPIIISPYDAELFGHWWYEGPEFLDRFLRLAAGRQDALTLTTPSRYLEEHPTQQLLVPSASSWGHKGYWEVWLDESNAWIYPHLHIAARRMIELATRYAAMEEPPPLVERALRQLARELLLAQSSDWAFLMKTGTARAYATKRTKDHILRFTRLYDQIKACHIDENFLANCEWRDNLFANLNWRLYAQSHP